MMAAADGAGTGAGGAPTLYMDLLDTEPLCVLRYDPANIPAFIPALLASDGFVSVTRTPGNDELSIVCAEEKYRGYAQDSPAQKNMGGWLALKVRGPLDFALVGILAKIATTLADAGVSIFALSTYDTDYVLVQKDHAAAAVKALNATDGISCAVASEAAAADGK